MCVIVHKPAGQIFPKDEIEKCWRRNGDGAGFFALKNDGRTITKNKIDSIDDFLSDEDVKEALEKESNSVFHFRIASRGGNSIDLTHPFKINLLNNGLPCEGFLFHNGTISFIDSLPSGFSDTKFLSSILEGLEIVDVIQILKNINRKSTNQFVKNGRFVLCCLSPNQDFACPAIRLGDDESVEKNGLWFSNLKHEGYNLNVKKSIPTVGTSQRNTPNGSSIYLLEKGQETRLENGPIFFSSKNGVKTTTPTREDLIHIITKFYCEEPEKEDEIEAMRAVLVKSSNFNVLPLRQLEAIALLCEQEGVPDPINHFSELFSW
jgi:hypothetical protein